jgi:hypothetical protein
VAVASVLVLALALGCGSSDFIEVHGVDEQGTAIDLHLGAHTAQVMSLQPQLGTVDAVEAEAHGPDQLRGMRLEWFPGLVASGQPYSSSAAGPVVFYMYEPLPGGGPLDVIGRVATGGPITFDIRGKASTGTLGALTVSYRDASGVDHTAYTLGSGAFAGRLP